MIAAVALLVALGLSGVGATPAAGSTTAAADAASGSTSASGSPTGSGRITDATTDADSVVEQTHVVRLAPAEPDTVYVDTTLQFERPDAFERYSIDFTETDAYAMSSTTDFERDGDAWVLEGGTSTATFTTEIYTPDATYSGSTAASALVVFPLADWDRYEDASGTNLSPERATTLVADGEGVVREDKVLLGSYRRYTETRDGTTVELLVSDDAAMEPDPATVTQSLAAASTTLAGPRLDVTVVAVRDYLDVAGYAAEWSVVVKAEDPAASADSTWLHEYVHASERIDKAPDFYWFTEGYAEYEAALLALEQGFADWEAFRSHLAFDETDATVANLTDVDTWGSDVEDTDIYGQGAITLGWIDRQIRNATDGRYALGDVVERLHSVDRVTTRYFLERVAEVADRDVARDAERYLSTRTVPPTWSASEHETAFGYDPTVEGPDGRGFHTELVDGTEVRDLDGDGNYRDVTGDGSVTNSDVTTFFANQHTSPWDERVDLFDFDGDDDVGQSDVVALFEYVTSM